MIDKNSIRKTAKADRHSHGGLSCSLEAFKKICGCNIDPPPSRMPTLENMEAYIQKNLLTYFYIPGIFEKVIQTAVSEAIEDGVTILEMSIDYKLSDIYNDKEEGMASFLDNLASNVSSKIYFRPELGIDRAANPKESVKIAERCINTGIFKAIDLYGVELSRPPDAFVNLYKKARKKGLKLKAHAGEYGDADFVLHSVNVLELDEVQHGISAAKSEKVMKELRERNIRLNICPTSNVMLCRVKDLKTHPVKILADAGVNVSINTDDIMIFGQSLTDEYYNLLKAGVFSGKEILNLMEMSLIN